MTDSMRKVADSKKLISFSEDTKKIREMIPQISYDTGLTESRIIEDCLIYGFCLIHGDKVDITEIINIMKKRYGNIINEDKLESIIRFCEEI